MKKNYLSIVLLSLLLVVILSGCTKKDAQDAIKLIPLVGGDEEINEAIVKKDLSLCKKLEGKDDLATLRRQNKCIDRVARAIGDHTACYLLKDVDNPKEVDSKAVISCATEIAVEKVDVSVCEYIDNFDYDVKSCYAKLAPLLKDATICSKTGEGTEWKTCIRETAKAAENIAICDNFEVHTLKSSCQVDVATIKKDASLCERIETESRKDICYQNIAKETSDASLCDEISTDVRKEKCQKDLEVKK